MSSAFKDRIRQKLASINNRGQSNAYWSPPKDGVATIRMFPYPHSEDPFLEYYFHFNIGKQSILCPQKSGLGASCPICDLASELYRSDNQQDKELSKNLYARQRFYATVLDRADETKTGKYWGFSQTIYIKLLNWLEKDNGDYEMFLDLKKGLDLNVGLQKSPGKMFPSAEVEASRRESPLAATDAEIKAILQSVKPASEVFVPLTANEIQGKLTEWLNSMPSNDEQPPSRKEPEGVVKGAGVKEIPRRRQQPTDVDSLFEQNFPGS